MRENRRNVKIEIIRLIACMAVIWYHVRELPWKIDGELSETAVFFECLCTICVMTFFLITGFFIYDKRGTIIGDWLSFIKKFLSQVFVPFLIIAVITLIFHDFLISRESFAWCVQNASITYIFTNLFKSLRYFTVNYLPGTAAHLWYVFSYATIIIAYPITRYIIRKLPKYVTYIILIILTICMIINDYFLFFGNPTYNLVFKIIHKPIYYSMWGHVLYNAIIKRHIDDKLESSSDNNKIFIIHKPIFIVSIVIYIVTFILLFKTQVNYYLGTNGEYVYTSWLSTYSLILTTAFMLIIYDINIVRFIDDKIKNGIYYLSSKTFGIYMVHYLIITKLLSIGFQSIWTNNRPTFFHHLIYYMFYSLLIFVISFIVVVFIEYIVKRIKNIKR